jgi:hypothetical protein
MSKEQPDEMSRTYIHKHRGCGRPTIIRGVLFRATANPFAMDSGTTMCAGCGREVRYQDVVWQDTGETLADFRRRLRREAPLMVKVTAFLVGPLLFALLGWGVYRYFRPGEFLGLPVAIIGGIGIWGVSFMQVTPRLFGIDFRDFE